MGKVWLVFGVLVILSFAGAESANSPAPAVDCSTVVLNMLECIPFLTNSTVTKPEGSCCSGLKTVLKTSPDCLCEGLKDSAQYGIVLNMTKAVTLPSACGVSASASQCGVSHAPHGAPEPAPAHSPAAHSPAAHSPAAHSPALSPKSAKSPASAPSSTAPTPSGTDPSTPTSGSITANAPAPAPGAPSSASSVSIPFTLLLSVIVASYSFF